MTSVGVMASAVTIAATTFPVLATANTETGNSLGTANPIPSPSGITIGDLLLATCAHDTGNTVTASTGWTQVVTTTAGGVHRLTTFARIADGGANDTLSLTGDLQDYCASILRITGHGVATITTDIQSAIAFNGSISTIDPPSLDTGTSRKWLWIVAGGLDQSAANQITAVSSGYTLAHTILSSAASASSSGLAVAWRTNEAQTDDPGLFTNTARPWAAFTIGVPPA